MDTNITFYVPCYNASLYLDQCISSILKQTYSFKEILIINDASTDNSVEICKKYPVTIIHHSKNLGLSASRNTALERCGTEFIASVDADVLLREDWLERIMSNFTDTKIAGAGGQLQETCLKSLGDQWRAEHMRQWWGEKIVINPEFLFGHSNVYRKKALQDVAGYDPILKTNGEDYDLCKKLRQKGYTLIYDPGAVALHIKSDTVRSVIIAAWRYTAWEILLNKISWPRVWGRILVHIKIAFKRVTHDIQELKFKLVFVDMLQCFFSIYYDFKLVFVQKRVFI